MWYISMQLNNLQYGAKLQIVASPALDALGNNYRSMAVVSYERFSNHPANSNTARTTDSQTSRYYCSHSSPTQLMNVLITKKSPEYGMLMRL